MMSGTPARSSDAAPNIQNTFGMLNISKFKCMVYHVDLRLQSCLFGYVTDIIEAMVHVLPPDRLPQRGGLIIEAFNALVQNRNLREGTASMMLSSG
jgi:hypothetical protein